MLLVVDVVGLDVRWELAPGRGESFPHVYGPLPTSNVVAVVDFPPRAGGHFGVPDEVRAAVAAGLLERYAEPHRRYHGLTHLAEVLAGVDSLGDALPDRTAVRLAAWFHDAVYEPVRADNEERSADLAEQVLGEIGLSSAVVAEVGRLVRLTASHTPAPQDEAGSVLCDADLAVLASEPARYAAYVAGVRAEYEHLDDATFATGRRMILQTLLKAPMLFRTPLGRQHYEQAARVNISAELVGEVPPRSAGSAARDS